MAVRAGPFGMSTMADMSLPFALSASSSLRPSRYLSLSVSANLVPRFANN